MNTKNEFTAEEISQMVKELYDFAKNENNLILREFIALQGMSQEKFAKLVNSHSELKEAFNYARLRLGIRREKSAMDELINLSIYKDYAPIYDLELREYEMEKRKGSLTIEEGKQKLDLVFAGIDPKN